MDKLTRVIGVAPSEVPLASFIGGRLAEEQDRVRGELFAYREANKPKPKKITKLEKEVIQKRLGKSPDEIDFILKQQKIELERLQREVEKMEEEKDGN